MLLATCGLACSGGGHVVRDATDALPQPPASAPATVPAVVEAIRRVRGHARKSAVRVDVLPRDALLARRRILRELGRSRIRPPTELDRLIEPEPEEAREKASEAMVAAFYEVHNDAVVVPTHPGGRDRHFFLLAHELEHAVVAERFEFSKWNVSSDDEVLAHLALIEGDATATATAIQADERGIPTARLFLRHVEARAAHDLRGWAANESPSRHEAERHGFAYGAGTSFVVGLWRIGRFSMVDEALRHPPVSTAQILEPQRYVDGHQPAPVAPLQSVAGLVPRDTTTLGAFRMGVVARRCRLAGAAGNPAEGWDGDRITRLVPAGKPGDGDDGSLVLASTWRTMADAERATELARGLVACLSPQGHTHVVRRDRAVIAVSTRSDPAHVIEAAVRSIGATPPDVPRGTSKIPPSRPLPRRSDGDVHDGVFTSGWLGVSVPVGRLDWSVGVRGAELRLRAGGFRAGLFVSERIHSREHNERLLDELRYHLEARHRGRLRHLGDVQETSKLGTITRRRYEAPDGSHLSIDLAPICNATGSLVYVSNTDAMAEALGRGPWLAAAPVGPRPPPVCERLDPR